MTTPGVRELIWLSVKRLAVLCDGFYCLQPLIRIAIPAAVGFTLVKRKLFPGEGTKALSLLIINFTLPCLLFSKIVPSFTPDNVHALGPIILAAFFYQALPGILGVLARAITETPRCFRYGILSAYMFGNWGDLPTAVIYSIAANAPFNGASDEALGIAYVSGFILVNYISSFPLQGLRLVQVDYHHPPDPARELRYEDGEFGAFRKYANRLVFGRPMRHELEEQRCRQLSKEGAGKDVSEGELDLDGRGGEATISALRYRQPRLRSIATQTDPNATSRTSRTPVTGLSTSDCPPLETVPTNLSIGSAHTQADQAGAPSDAQASDASLSQHPSTTTRILDSIWRLLRPIVTSPPTMVLLSALIIALIPDLRILFIPPTSSDASFAPTAPDGLPPLAVLYDTASFVGAASVPLGLIVLGASIAKLRLPKPLSRLPLAGIVAMALIRLVVVPVCGFFFVKQLVKIGMVEETNAVLRFVMVLFSCVPTATNQVTYQIIFAPSGVDSNADLLAAYLLAQYAVWAFSSVVLTAFNLNSLKF
ncbi:Protein M3 [Rhodotorula toruloides]